MHPGNIFVARENPQTPKYIAVDMAVVGSLSREDQYYLARNILAMFRRDYRQVAELHVYSGWVDEDTSVSELEAAVRSVCEPIFEKPLGEISFGQVLITLFATARRFNMEVQPQLVLLQKTLLNIEGLGRQLYPELDLWQTAHPYMEKWLKDRFSPRSLVKELQRYGPEWLEKFPEVPNLVFANLDRFAELAKLTPDIQQLVHQQQQAGNTKRAKLKRLWLPLAAAAGISAWPEAQAWFAAQPVVTLILAGMALTAWWWLA
jgi:ubiquinone biosynthesis protein